MGERGVALFSRGRVAPPWLTRTLLLAYALMFLNTMQYATMFALAPTFKDALDLSKFETGLAMPAAAVPIGLAVDRLGALYTVCFPLAGVGADAVGVGRGAVYAALQAVGGLATAVGPLAAGKLGESVGDWVAYAGVTGLCVVAAWILVASRRPQLPVGSGSPSGSAIRAS